MVNLFANSHIVVSLFESLPKDKVQLLGTAEVSLFDRFLKNKNPKLSVNEVIPLVYTNAKLLQPGSDAPEIQLQISLSRPILSEGKESGSMVSFTVQDVYPVPEEWSLKEGSDKDLNSNIFTYNLEFSLPGDSQNSQRKITINNGLLVPCESVKVLESPVTMTEPESSNVSSTKATDASTALDSKKVSWAYTYHVFMSSETFEKLREKAQRHEPLDLEFSRSVNPKFATAVDSSAQKYRAIAHVDLSPLLFPGVLGVFGITARSK